MRIRSIIFALALVGTAATAHAQDGALERVHNLIATGRLTEARNTLAEWERENRDPQSAATPDDRARALFLTGLLSSDAKKAEDAFIGVVLSYPSAAVAPEALLRLGQGLYTAGETDRAITYLERLRSDYPGVPQHETGMLWLTRAQLASGNAAAACGTARESLFSTTNANVRTLIELERDRACAQSGGIAESSAATPSSSSTQTGAAVQPPSGIAPNAGARPAPVTPLVLPDLGIAVDSVPWDSAQRSNPPAERTEPRVTAPQSSTPAQQQPAALPVAPSTAEPTPVNTAEFAVQTAAFSERRAAESIAAELRAKGFDARIVTVPGSPYFRVRFGAFMTSREAAAAALRIHDAGFATLIVNDVRLERRL